MDEAIVNSYFHFPGCCGTDNESCFSKIVICNAFLSREGCVFGAASFTTKLGVSARAQDLSASRNEYIDVRSVRSQCGDSCVAVVSRVPDHHSLLPAICETCMRVTSRAWKQSASGRVLSWSPSRSANSSRIPRFVFISSDTVAALVARFFDTCTE